ncbi:hypothetical protein [Paenibacillus sp. FJAT-26967]|uniref:hypothetical protein n=1 Tax=Paenibacillus sp. FJAT-26967 TaxID=1729690 RepID=UPI000838C87E|nr:hypothetical protein [Paenibacillus sp. FJAT-26967]
MTDFKPLLALVLFMSLLSGCNKETNDNKPSASPQELQTVPGNRSIEFERIASEKILPANFHEIAFERKTTPLFQYVVRKAVDQSQLEEAWNLYGFKNNLPNIDLNKKDVLFLGLQESGSCPYTLKNIERSPDDKTITVPFTVSISGQNSVCTSDATPRTFVFALDKEISNVLESVVIVQSEVETSIPLENEPLNK